MKLAIGTAQLGMIYGISGRRQMPLYEEVVSILKRAHELGIALLDTSPKYGNIEARLKNILDSYPFTVVSKIPNLKTIKNPEKEINDFILDIQKNLKNNVQTILFHSSDDLLGSKGDYFWEIASNKLLGTNIKLGVSCYSPSDAEILVNRYPINTLQLPGNAFDQRLYEYQDSFTNVDVHLRSIFLQGALVRDSEFLFSKIPKIEPMLNKWKKWCSENNLSRLQAAIGVAKSFPSCINYCIVGVDGLDDLEKLYAAWCETKPIYAPWFSINDLDIIDPRLW